MSSDFATALRHRELLVRPEIETLEGSQVRFVDGQIETVDAIVCATGYRIAFPFLSPALLEADGSSLPLYRRMVAPHLPGLYFVGLIEKRAGRRVGGHDPQVDARLRRARAQPFPGAAHPGASDTRSMEIMGDVDVVEVVGGSW